MRDSGVLEFSSGSLWTAREFARAARNEEEHCCRIGSARGEVYAQAVADTIFHVLGDHGLVQQTAAMDLIVSRHRSIRML